MKLSNIVSSFLIISISLFAITSCEKKLEIIPDEPLVIEDTWTFSSVRTTAPIVGEFTDSNPTGMITFEEDGTGSSTFSFDVVGALGAGVPINQSETFTWTKLGSTVTMINSDDETIIWTLANENSLGFDAAWTQSVGSFDAIDFEATLTTP